ncbi:hypothetical protein DERF_014763 [Dermatophagoides farinae]|uniref:Uncharacterized protein n=1 Tax=Dermatophagoides farinae TaxID=6954 RepID=A0A922HJG1_DERFA|nr:hypothetical protein DERF_014763 [Dermatophagoides farinae]
MVIDNMNFYYQSQLFYATNFYLVSVQTNLQFMGQTALVYHRHSSTNLQMKWNENKKKPSSSSSSSSSPMAAIHQ